MLDDKYMDGTTELAVDSLAHALEDRLTSKLSHELQNVLVQKLSGLIKSLETQLTGISINQKKNLELISKESLRHDDRQSWGRDLETRLSQQLSRIEKIISSDSALSLFRELAGTILKELSLTHRQTMEGIEASLHRFEKKASLGCEFDELKKTVMLALTQKSETDRKLTGAIIEKMVAQDKTRILMDRYARAEQERSESDQTKEELEIKVFQYKTELDKALSLAEDLAYKNSQLEKKLNRLQKNWENVVSG